MTRIRMMEKQKPYKVDWQHFSLQDFLELRWRLLHDYDAVLPGGEYFGQVRCGDVCYDIQIEWLDADIWDRKDGNADVRGEAPETERELFVTMSPFFPHAKEDSSLPYDELVPGMPYDTQKGGSLVCARRDFLRMAYEDFQLFAERGIADKIAVFPRLQQEACRLTGFWDKHDAILCRLREQEKEGQNGSTDNET